MSILLLFIGVPIPIGSPIIVTIWNVVFAHKSRKLGWIWMKLGRWGWGLKRLSLARFQRNRTMGFGESAKKWVAEALFFLSRERRTTSATFLGSISAKLPTNTCPGGVSRQMVSHSRKVSIKGSNLPKNVFLGYFRLPFVFSLRVAGNVLWRLHSFHSLVDIPQIYPS